MICTISKSQEEKLKLMPRTNMTFINGSANFKFSTLSDHAATDGHKRAIKKKNHEDAISADSSTRTKKVSHEVPTYLEIGSDFRKMGEKREKHWSNLTIQHITSLLNDASLPISKT